MDDGNSALLSSGLDGLDGGGGGATRYDSLKSRTFDAVLAMLEELLTACGGNNLENLISEIGPHPAVETEKSPVYALIEKVRAEFGYYDLLLPFPGKVMGKDGTTKGKMDK